jgi:hypothetical protein
MEPKTIEEICAEYREGCKVFEVGARRMVQSDYFRNEQAYFNQHSEMKAQLMLAVRHLEDARMRFGKVLQYAGNGVSIYDKA